jgi:predicted ATPase
VFVPLAAVTQPAQVLGTIGRAMRADLGVAGAPLEAVVEQLGEGDWLLILDNLEQVIDAARDLDELLTRCPGVLILATSRTVLGLRAEREYAVPPLPLPPDTAGLLVGELEASPAVALFVDRARAVRHDFALTTANAPAVVEICRRLEGLPLAIELAATRIRLLGPDVLPDRLATSMDALGVGAVDLPERQHTPCGRPSGGASACCTTRSGRCWRPWRCSWTAGQSTRPPMSPASMRTGPLS